MDANCIRAGLLLIGAAIVHAQTPVFKADTDLQSIAVRVTDKKGHAIEGLQAFDFTIFEEGRPQKTAFFGAEHQPVSLAVMLDASSSMESSRKLGRARTLLRPLIRGSLPEDQIFFSPFTDRVKAFEELTQEQRLDPPMRDPGSLHGGTALYDALATSLCNLRAARNVRQAVIVITDGSDQHSRLRIEQLIHFAQASRAQIFMIGFFDKAEYDYYKESGEKAARQ